MRPLLTVAATGSGMVSLALLLFGAGALAFDGTVYQPLGILFASAGGAGAVATMLWLRVVVGSRQSMQGGLRTMQRAWGWMGFAVLVGGASIVVSVLLALES